MCLAKAKSTSIHSDGLIVKIPKISAVRDRRKDPVHMPNFKHGRNMHRQTVICDDCVVGAKVGNGKCELYQENSVCRVDTDCRKAIEEYGISTPAGLKRMIEDSLISRIVASHVREHKLLRLGFEPMQDKPLLNWENNINNKCSLLHKLMQNPIVLAEAKFSKMPDGGVFATLHQMRGNIPLDLDHSNVREFLNAKSAETQ